MSEREQITHFDLELKKLIRRFAAEYQLSNASVIGTLQLNIHEICDIAMDEMNGDDENPEKESA